MISLRYHVLSLGAAFLSLAVGVVLGATTLSGTAVFGGSGEQDRLGDRVAELETERDALDARLAGLDAFAGSIGADVVDGSLDQRTVLLVTDHDVSRSVRDGVVDLVERAGATVTGGIRLTGSVTDPDRSGELRELVLQLQPAGVRMPVDGEPGALAGTLLGSVLLLDPADGRPHATADERAAVVAGLLDGGFLTAADAPAPAELAVVLTGDPSADAGAAFRAVTLSRIATRLDRSGSGTVLAGPLSAAAADGAIGAARADPDATAILSTVDGVRTAAGRIATVLALREQLDGRAGRYGAADNAEAPAPRS